MSLGHYRERGIGTVDGHGIRIVRMRTCRGMTLVEVMIAIVLLAAFTTAAVGVVVQVARASEAVRQRTTAVALAWSRIERARHVDASEFGDLAEAAPGNVIDENGLPDSAGGFRRRTIINTVTNGLPMSYIRVDVWPRNLRTGAFSGEPESMETVIADIPRRGGHE